MVYLLSPKYLEDFHFLSIKSRLFSEDTKVLTTVLASKADRQNSILPSDLGLRGKGNHVGKR